MKEIEGKSDKYIAAFAVRTNSLEILKLGLDSSFKSNATADYRDVISALVLYYDAAKRLTEDPDRFLLEYAKNHQGYIKSHITNFVSRAPEDKKISVGGYVIVHDPEFNYKFKIE
jgi:hypothetical protein